MFEKSKIKLKNKLRIWLEIDLVEKKQEKLKNVVTDNINKLEDGLYRYSREVDKQLLKQNNSIEALHNTVESVVHIGTDVRENRYGKEHSWAVICLEGKMNVVKFIDLGNSDIREILRFLKSFESGRHCIDTPRKEIFYDNLFKF